LVVVLSVVASSPVQDSKFSEFLVKYHKQYTAAELPQRYEAFKENMKMIEEHNKKSSFSLGINEFADVSHKEFIMTKLLQRITVAESNAEDAPHVAAPPAAVDWRKNTAPVIVGPVRQGGQCASSLVDAVIDSISSDYSVTNGDDVYEFDPAYVTDCSGQGCSGSDYTAIFSFITKFGLNWYYTPGACPTGPGLGLCISGTNCTKAGSESDLQATVASRGPVPIMIDASHSSFQLYTSGVYYEKSCSSTSVDHAMLLVGYGTTSDGQDYWIARNSWGPTWGQNGDIFLARNKDNNCGVASAVCFAKSVRTCVCDL